jgi:multidrug efflux pump subunit AcrA (membrane-fusion protein)
MGLVSRVPSRPVVLLAACAVALPLSAASCDDEPASVTLGSATRATVAENVEVPGAVTARAAATLTAPSDGTLAALRVQPGERIAKGHVVAVIDSPAARRRLDEAARALDSAPRGGTAAGATTDVTAVRHRTDADAGATFHEARTAAAAIADPTVRTALLAQVAAAEQRYAEASRAVDDSVRSVQQGITGLTKAVDALGAAQLLQARQAYALADAAVDALTLRAPVAGVVQPGGAAARGASITDLLSAGAAGAAAGVAAAPPGNGALPGVDVAVPEGAAVSAGTPIVTIVDTTSLGVVAEVDETDILLVRPGTAAAIEFDAAAGATYRGTVRTVDVLPTTSARGGVSYRVRLSLAQGAYDDGRAAPAPRPGMSAIVRLRVRQAADAVTVPASAVFTADGGDAVWTVRGGRAQRVAVTLGVQGDDVVQIVSGVGAGQQIVVGGTDDVRPGQQVG